MLSRSRHAFRHARFLDGQYSAGHWSGDCKGLFSAALGWHGSLNQVGVKELLHGENSRSCEKQEGLSVFTRSSLLPALAKAGQQSREFASRGAPDMREAKLLTRAITGCRRWEQLELLVRSRRRGFNYIHFGAAMVQFARLYKVMPLTRRLQLKGSATIQELEQLTALLLPQCGAQAVANILHSFATLEHSPAPEVLQPLAEAVARKLSGFKPQELANVLWAFATLQHDPGPVLLGQLAEEVSRNAADFKPQELVNSLWAFAKLQHQPGAEFLEHVAGEATRMLPGFTSQGLSNTLWAFATLQHQPGQELLVGMTHEVSRKLPGFNEQEVANTLWAFATLQHQPAAELLDGIAYEVGRKLPCFKPQGIANTLWAFATLRHQPAAGLLDSMADEVGRKLLGFNPQNISNTLWAFVKLEYHPQPALLQALISMAHQARPAMVPQNVANTVWALGKLQPASVPSKFLAASCRYLEAHAGAFEEQHLSNFMLGLAHLKYRPSRTAVGAVVHEAVVRMPRFKHQHLANLTWSFGKLAVDPGDSYWNALCAEIPGKAVGFIPQNVSNFLLSAAKLRRQLDVGALEALCGRAWVIVPEYNELELWNSAWALAKLGCHPARAFLAALTAEADAKADTFSPSGTAIMIWSLDKLGQRSNGALLDVAQRMLERGENMRGEELTEEDYERFMRVLETHSDNR